MADASDLPSPSPTLLPPEAEIEEIPGVGVLRARCLRKAGWANVGALRTATAEQLAGVPGITELKARQIIERINTPTAPAPLAPAAKPDAPHALVPAITQSAIALAGAPHMDPLHPSLARQLVRWIDRSALLEACEPFARGRTLRRLDRIGPRVEAAIAKPGKSAAQRRLAQRLRWLRRRLVA